MDARLLEYVEFRENRTSHTFKHYPTHYILGSRGTKLSMVSSEYDSLSRNKKRFYSGTHALLLAIRESFICGLM